MAAEVMQVIRFSEGSVGDQGVARGPGGPPYRHVAARNNCGQSLQYLPRFLRFIR